MTGTHDLGDRLVAVEGVGHADARHGAGGARSGVARLVAMPYSGDDVMLEFATRNLHPIIAHPAVALDDAGHMYTSAPPTSSGRGVWLRSASGAAWADRLTRHVAQAYDVCKDRMRASAQHGRSITVVATPDGEVADAVGCPAAQPWRDTTRK